ncbi:MAG: DUF4919 domain-containing protein [Bacteroidaceae bacterium]|nr:DUF4919 domain-containing protein [Bacteroidaceae bacterium]
MKKLLISTLFCIMATLSYSQTLLDMETIKEIATTEKEYYKDIVGLFNNDDPYLDVNDVAIVYYGQAFQPYYMPAGNKDEAAMKEYSEKNDYSAAYNTAKKIIKTNPVSLNALFTLLISAKELGMSEEECRSYASRYMRILNMIMEYGNGKSRETAFKVITPDDQDYILYGKLNIEKVISNELDTETLCNIFLVEPSAEFQQRRVYFDLSIFLNSEVK